MEVTSITSRPVMEAPWPGSRRLLCALCQRGRHTGPSPGAWSTSPATWVWPDHHAGSPVLWPSGPSLPAMFLFTTRSSCPRGPCRPLLSSGRSPVAPALRPAQTCLPLPCCGKGDAWLRPQASPGSRRVAPVATPHSAPWTSLSVCPRRPRRCFSPPPTASQLTSEGTR